jgi:hypothetical protein
MTTPTIYRSTDASAPACTGEVGKLIALLKACLVTGYGTQPAAGWTEEYTATNYSVLRQGGGLQHYLWINDIDARMSRLVGYATMTGILSGTNPYFSEAIFPGGMYCRKSISADTVARPWILLATDETFYLIIFGGSTTFGQYGGGDAHLACGQLQSRLTGDAMHAFLIGATDTSTTSTSASTSRQVLPILGNSATGHAIASTYTQISGGINFGKRPQNNLFAQTVSGNGGSAYPDPVGGALFLEPIIAQENSTLVLRGTFPGLWSVGHAHTSFSNMDTVTGTGTLAGREFLIVLTGTYAIAFQTNGGW